MEDFIGKICPFCKAEIKEGDAVKVCPSCGVPHHEACWKENNGCTTAGCAERHTVSADAAADGDTLISGDQTSAPAFQTPETVKPKKSKKLLFVFIAIGAALAAVAAVVYFIFFGSFEGRYMSVNGKSFYEFRNGSYTYDSGDADADVETGTYRITGNHILMTDSEGEEKTYYKDGRYIYNDSPAFDNAIIEGKKISQTLESVTPLGLYDGDILSMVIKLQLKSDGTCTWSFRMELGDRYIGDETKLTGTYERSGKWLKRYSDSSEDVSTYIIKDGFVYDSIYKK